MTSKKTKKATIKSNNCDIDDEDEEGGDDGEEDGEEGDDGEEDGEEGDAS
jgi:hypothetical protein